MRLFACGAALLALAFACHVVLWRVALPRRQIQTLICTFALVPLAVAAVCVVATPLMTGLSLSAGFRLALFYGSCAIVYVIAYSLVENESPTLAIVSYVASKGEAGCDEAELSDHLAKTDATGGRIRLMEVSGLIAITRGVCGVTPKGRFFAALFEFSAGIFHLRLGG